MTEHHATLRGNIFGGLTAAIVALPLALAFGVASGVGPIAGLYGAIMTGFFAALFGGTPTQISGPTGPMTVVMASILTLFIGQHPETGLALAFTTVMIGGLVQIALGYFKLGRYINFVPYTVVSGFMTGIGVIIILLQIAPFVGSELVINKPLVVVQQFVSLLSGVQMDVLILSGATLLTLMIWPKRLTQIFPSPLFVLLAGTLATHFLFQSGSIQILGEVPTGLPSLQIPVFELDVLVEMLKYGLVLGLLGTIDSLLTSLVADSMTRTEHNPDKELVGQGLGNLMAGLFGGLPGAGATMRTVVNIRAGGVSRLSGIVHAVTLLLIVLLGGHWVSLIPQPVLAAILVKVGIDIIDWPFLRRLRLAPASSIVITVSVLVLTVTVDLITAVGVGIVIASLSTVKKFTDLQLAQTRTIMGNEDGTLSQEETEILDTLNDRVLIYSLSGPFSFGAAKGLTRQLNAFNDHDILLLDLVGVPLIDTSTALAIEEIIHSSRRRERPVVVACSSEKVLSILRRLGVIQMLGEHKLFSSRIGAIQKAKALYAEKFEKLP